MVQPFLPARWTLATVDAVDDPSVYPDALAAGFFALKTPVWSTKIATASSGRERRLQLWSYPRWQFKIPYEVLRAQADSPEVQKLWAFFNSHAAQAGEFSLRDATDFQAANAPFGVGDGATTTFQLSRTMGSGDISFSEPVFSISGMPAILVNGVATTAFTLGALGKVTFETAPAAGVSITWSGQFMFRVRFTADTLDTAQILANGWTSQGVELLSIKP